MEVSWLILIIILAIVAGIVGLIWYLCNWKSDPTIAIYDREIREAQKNLALTNKRAWRISYLVLLRRAERRKARQIEEGIGYLDGYGLDLREQVAQPVALVSEAVQLPRVSPEEEKNLPKIGDTVEYVPLGRGRDQRGLKAILCGILVKRDGTLLRWVWFPWCGWESSSGEYPQEAHTHSATCDLCQAAIAQLSTKA